MERDKPRANGGMNQPLTIEELVSIHKLMHSMLHEAESGNWRALSQLDAQRIKLIEQNGNSGLLSQVQPTQNTAAEKQDYLVYNARCNEILQLDAKITETVQKAKQQLVDENRHMRNQIVAKKGYAQTATIHTSSYNQK
jgi:hypothetical protein